MDQIHRHIGYRFKDAKLLEKALTHPSASIDGINYERLEFLGDAVLGLVASEMLFHLFPNDSEGHLAKKKTALVCGNSLTEVAKSINLGQFIIMSHGERSCGGKENSNNLENTLEALIGAIYIDGGFEVVRRFILQYWSPIASEMTLPPQDTKTALQEWAQSKKLPIPSYRLVSKSGPEHNPVFTVEVSVLKCGSAIAKGNNKKSAEQEAARLMLAQVIN